MFVKGHHQLRPLESPADTSASGGSTVNQVHVHDCDLQVTMKRAVPAHTASRDSPQPDQGELESASGGWRKLQSTSNYLMAPQTQLLLALPEGRGLD